MIPFDQVAAVALSNAPALLRDWLPGGKMRGREYVVGGLNGAPGESMSVNTLTGRWADFASDARGGDLVSLYAALKHNNDQGRAARELSSMLGVQTDTRDPAPAPAAPEWTYARPPEDAPAAPLHGYDHVYAYRDEVGDLLHYVCRRDARGDQRKQIIPLCWGNLGGRTGWHQKQPPTPRPLYGLDRLHTRSHVIVCEGEKAADAAQAMLPRAACVTWMAGTGNVSRSDWSPLSGKHVLIWPDNDASGHKAAGELRTILSAIAATVRILRVDDQPEGADAADLITDDPASWVRDRAGAVVGGTVREPSDQPGPIVQTSRRAAGLAPITVRAGEIDLTATAGETALTESGLPIYQRGPQLVRPARMEVIACGGRVTTAAGLTEITSPAMIDMLSQAVEWKKWDARKNDYKQVDPPPNVAAVIMSRIGRWSFPPIAGVVTAPTLRPDGSVLTAPGYDPATRLYHVDDPSLGLVLPEPTRANAELAARELADLLIGFPFSGDVDRSVAMSALITPIVRGAMQVVPMVAIGAMTPGSGKSYLGDLVAYLATGRPCPVMTAADDDAETDKRLTAMLMAGYPIISIDNCNGELGTDTLNQAIERPLISLRELGRSHMIEIENRVCVFATGNGLRVRGDMVRRSLLCRLDAGMERPELRSFPTLPHEMILADRGAYIGHALTIVRAYLASEQRVTLPPLASFEGWSRTVRAALVWLGYADPCLSMEEARAEDPELGAIRSLMTAWQAHVGAEIEITLRRLDEMSLQHSSDGSYAAEGLREAMLAIAPGPGGSVSTIRLAKWLAQRRGRIVGGLTFDRGGETGGVARWKLRRVGGG